MDGWTEEKTGHASSCNVAGGVRSEGNRSGESKRMGQGANRAQSDGLLRGGEQKESRGWDVRSVIGGGAPVTEPAVGA